MNLTRTQALRLAHDTGNPALARALASPSRAAAATRERTGDGSIGLTLPWPPSVNAMYRVCQGRSILSAAGRAFKSSVAGLRYGAKPLTGEVDVWIRLYRPQRRGDTDNYLKATLDGLKGVAFKDDAQVRDIFVYRRDDKAAPRVEVVVRPAAAEVTS